jgi:hypothetical protein
MNLKTLDFGAPAAERDINHGLVEYFFKSEAYSRVESRQKYIVLGNRGTGKSALFKFLAEQAKRNQEVVIELSPEDYSYEILASALIREKEGSWAKQGAYAAAWKYLIYVLVMKGLNIRLKGFKSGPQARIYGYLRDHHRDSADGPIGVLVSYIKRIEGVKIGSFEANLKTRQLTALYKLEELHNLMGDLKEVLSKQPVRVFVDELDRGWDSSEDAKAFVAGLFQAAISINAVSSNLTVYISLRQELYDSIPALYEDTQKYRDVMELIRWDEPSLKHLIALRIRHSVSDLVALRDDDLVWNTIFSGTLQYRQTKGFNYIVDRTLYRPREIIQFCTTIVEENATYGTFPIDYDIISKAELTYSEDRTKDIASEYRFQYPGLMSVFEIFRGKTYTFDREELEFLCLQLSVGEHALSKEAESWIQGQDPSFIIETLWRIGFFRAQAVGGVKAQRRSGSSYLGPHQVGNLSLHNLARFHVHPMFRSYLGMKEEK